MKLDESVGIDDGDGCWFLFSWIEVFETGVASARGTEEDDIICDCGETYSE